MSSRPVQNLSSGTWLVIVLLAFAAVIGIGRMLLLSGQDRSPSTAPQP